MEIFLSRNGQQFGPYTTEWLESFLAEGSVNAEDLAWTAGREGWVPLRVLLAELKGPVAEPVVEVPAAPEPEPEPEPVQLAPQDDPPVSEPAPEPQPAPEPVQAASADEPPKLGLDPEIAAAVRGRPGLNLKGMWPGAAAVLVGIVLLTGLIMLANVPKHASITRNGEHWLLPDDGYTFADPNDPWKWEVQWTPGKPSLTQAAMLAGREEGKWVLAPGYDLGGAGQDPIWRPGKREDDYPYAIAADTPGEWHTDPGYVLADGASGTAPRTVWRAGIQLPHMVSADQEHHWKLDPGYDLVEKTIENPRAAWSPGARHRDYAHIYAGETEGRWRADDGYYFVQANDLRTFHVANTINAWNAATQIDAATSGIDCSNQSVLATVEYARDRYAAINSSEVHPLVAQNFASMQEALNSSANTISTCYVVKNAGDGADVAAGIWCAGRTLLADENYEECMARSKTARDVLGAASSIGGVACDEAMGNAWRRINELSDERQRLRAQFQDALGVQLPSGRYLVTCR